MSTPVSGITGESSAGGDAAGGEIAESRERLGKALEHIAALTGAVSLRS